MNKLLSGLMAAALGASFVIAPAVPLNAAPVFVPKAVEVRSDVETVKHRKWQRRHWRAERRYWRRQAWRDRHYYGRHYYDDDYYYYRRYGVRHPHRYWRRHRPGVTLEFSF
jgi:hypothetical protein